MDPLYLIYIGLHSVPPVFAGLAFYFRARLSLSTKVGAWSFIILYSLVMYGALATDVYLDYKLQQFNVNGDGIFSEKEITPEQELAMDKVVADTGRTFAPLTGLILSSVLAGILFLTMKLGVFVSTHLTRRSNAS